MLSNRAVWPAWSKHSDPSISILDEILLICKQPQVNSFSCARLSALTVCPEGINTNMKNLDSILSRPHRRLSLNTNHITSHPRTITAGYTLPGGEAASAERSIWGPNQKRLPFSGVCMRGGRGNGMQSWDGGLGKHPNYLKPALVALCSSVREGFIVFLDGQI